MYRASREHTIPCTQEIGPRDALPISVPGQSLAKQRYDLSVQAMMNRPTWTLRALLAAVGSGTAGGTREPP
jgi:hypothetical protein